MRCLTMTPVVARHPEDGPDPHISDRSAYLTESAGPDSASRPPSVPSHQRNGVASMTTGIYASFVAPGTLLKRGLLFLYSENCAHWAVKNLAYPEIDDRIESAEKY